MELKFIWIEDYKNVKQTGFNFNHSIAQEFQYINDEIAISTDKIQTPEFFFAENISSVTAIVGKNGSGKTNLGEFMNFNLAHVTNGALTVNFVGYKGILIIDKLIFFQESIKIKNIEDLESIGYELLDYKNAPLDNQGGRKWAEMSRNKYIYYSPVFEFRYINIRENLTNISTSYLAFNDINKTAKHYNLNRDFDTSYDKTDFLKAHYVNEMVRQSDFILNYNTKEFIGESPTNLEISIDLVEENRLLQTPSFYKKEDPKEIYENNLWDELNNLEGNIWNRGYAELSNYKLPEKDEQNRFEYYLIPVENQKDIFRRLFLINFFKIVLKTSDYKFDVGFFTSFLHEPEKLVSIGFIKKIFLVDNKLQSLINDCKWDAEKKRIIVESDFNSRAKAYSSLIHNAKLDTSIYKNKKDFLDLLRLIKEITQNRLSFHYQFSNNYSSGQQHLLNFYSRFYWAKNDLLDSEKNITYEMFRDRIIIFIDEGEVALHPEWQRLFFNKTVKFLSELFHDRKIQLILTTHSPFVLSDIPKNNVLFLDRNDDGNTEISDMERDNTFGANIYSLLSDSFFMENTIGNFAEEKMKSALDMLKTKHNDYSKEKINELKYIIDSIGEPMIKEQFEYLFNKKFGYDEISELKKRIIELENKNNQNDSN
ncbi:putative AbiEii toxin of type IV toxin-antitoxin system [Flavobacterium sp. 270]|uniref:AAA family ATPase n=1 Tax=Flavobacterium sp. 270 TaxID=2512114 RepID=UPI0010EA52DA|nr:AAA family ATPase [Flavobacterium sp. 270]TDW51576.1 putative AbiEii toxin of type IV toxin-antitoxin system [Flavobacterium sp. 270]